MPRIKDSSPLSETPFSLRLTPELEDKIKEAIAHLGMSKQELIRMAMGVGLEDLKRINYGVNKAVVTASEEVKKKQSATVAARIMRPRGAPEQKAAAQD